ncbi:hypothetical protein SPHINGO391_500097 [Sphingomonas aurantiaca]|uniref:Uncharacterized protein n=1 Tax=Sphingomonas aurantiaca TaxID=185949 RepID=A0A5E8AEB0_9SPHN|nr:hypothetical protein SPHINGO391_500097 [Sphingomonas aurantiaca]
MREHSVDMNAGEARCVGNMLLPERERVTGCFEEPSFSHSPGQVAQQESDAAARITPTKTGDQNAR